MASMRGRVAPKRNVERDHRAGGPRPRPQGGRNLERIKAHMPLRSGCATSSNVYKNLPYSFDRFSRSHICLSFEEGRISSSASEHFIDLTPLFGEPEAIIILMLTRGQLNRSFRASGLFPPDPIVVEDDSDVDPAHLDDPAALGVDEAMARFDDAFLDWSRRLPRALVRPVLEILGQTIDALERQGSGSGTAAATVLRVYEYLGEVAEEDPHA